MQDAMSLTLMETAWSSEAEPAQGTLEAWIRAARAGDHAAFERLVTLHEGRVLRLARSLARRPEDAWDLYQETFTKLYITLPRYRFECAFSTWVYRVATNTGLDYLRRHKVRSGLWHPLREDGTADGYADGRGGANPERVFLSQEMRARIGSALAALPARQRLVFELRHEQGLRQAEIAGILHTSEATVKNALFRATQKLRRALGGVLPAAPAEPAKEEL